MPQDVIGRLLYDLAEGQDGYFATQQAGDAGVSRATLAKAVQRGTLERPSRGVYRFVRFPVMSANAHCWEAVLWPHVRTQRNGVLSHYTALRLHGLSDVNPRQVHITLPKAFRQTRSAPPWLVVRRGDLTPEDITPIDNLPTTSLARTLRDVAALGDTVALMDALRDARARNLPVPDDLARYV